MRTGVHELLRAAIGLIRAQAEVAVPDVGNGSAAGRDAGGIVHLHIRDLWTEKSGPQAPMHHTVTAWPDKQQQFLHSCLFV